MNYLNKFIFYYFLLFCCLLSSTLSAQNDSNLTINTPPSNYSAIAGQFAPNDFAIYTGVVTDLVLSDFSFDLPNGNEVRPGQEVTATYTITARNNASPSTTFAGLINSTYTGDLGLEPLFEEEIPALELDESRTFTTVFTIPSDFALVEYSVQARVNPDGLIEESNTNNNAAFISLFVTYPDLEVTNISCPVEFPSRLLGSQLTYQVTFQNNGAIATSPSAFYLYQQSTGRGRSREIQLGQAALPAIGAGETATVEIVASFDDSGLVFPPFISDNGETGFGNFFFSLTSFELIFINTSSFRLTEPFDIFCKQTTTDVGITLTTDTPTFGADNKVRYTVTVTNNGAETAHNVQAPIGFKELPGGTVIGAPILSKGIIYNPSRDFPQKIGWYIESLAPGERATAEVVLELFLDDNQGMTDEETLTFAFYDLPSINDTDDTNNSASFTFTRGANSGICNLEFEFNEFLQSSAIVPGATVNIDMKFTNLTTESLPVANFGFYRDVYENGVVVGRKLFSSLVELPAFAPNEVKDIQFELTFNDPLLYEPGATSFNLGSLFAAVDVNDSDEFCALRYNFTFIDYRDANLALEEVNNLDCFGDDLIIPTDLKITNQGASDIDHPIVVFLGTTQVNLEAEGIVLGSNEVQPEFSPTPFAFWVIENGLSVGESATILRPYKAQNTTDIFRAFPRVDQQLTVLENTAAPLNLFYEYDPTCSVVNNSCTGDLMLTTQAEVNAFGNCNSYNGDITISGADITDLTPLNNLRSINGSLFITRNDLLADLKGLERLEKADVIAVDDNPNLVTAQQIQEIKTINQIIINNNPILEVGPDLRSQLTELNSLLVLGNPNLRNLVGFRFIENIEETLTITANGINFLGLSSLRTVGGFLSIVDNDNLTRINSLIDIESLGALILIENDQLNTCCELFPLLNENGVAGEVTIENNDSGCNSAKDIITTCNPDPCVGNITLTTQAEVDAFGDCEIYRGNITLKGTGITSLASLNTLKHVEGALLIVETSIQNLEGLNNLEQVEFIALDDNTDLSSIAALNNLSTATGGFSISNNDQLPTLNGLENFAQTGTVNIIDNELITTLAPLGNLTVSEALIITQNPNLRRLEAFQDVENLQTVLLIGNTKLESIIELSNLKTVSLSFQLIFSSVTELAGLEALQTVGEDLTIVQNANLENLDALSNLQSVKDFILTLNNSLSDCCGVFPIINNNGIINRADISENAIGCNSVQAILDNCDDPNPTNGIDLELTLTTNKPRVAIYESAKFTYTIRNTGVQAAKDVVLSIANDNVVLTNGEQPIASQGSVDYFNTQEWQVGTLAAGASATLEINYFFLAEPFLYGQVIAADGNDADSTPNNGNGQTANEDDEAVFPVGVVEPRLADLTLENLSVIIPPDVVFTAGDIVDYRVDVVNLGEIMATGDYTIGAFLSTDNQLDSSDPEVGVIPTGNTPVGTISDVPGAITIPSNTADGNYFLILKTDRDNTITESDEGNNVVRTTITIGSGGDCICTEEYDPVCGVDGVTYVNACEAACAGVTEFSAGVCPTTGEGIDLELNITAANPAVGVYQNTVFTLTISNTGTAAAKDVKVALPLTEGKIVLSGGTIPMLSQGTYNAFGEQVWELSSLAAGQSETLKIDLFFLAKPFVYAQVTAAMGDDSDSTPNNGNGQTANEDDEAIFGGQVGNNCNIIISTYGKRCNDNLTATDPSDDYFTFKIKPTGRNAGATYQIVQPVGYEGEFAYGEEKTLQADISKGAVELILQDANNQNCTTTLMISPPATCSDGGSMDELSLSITAPSTYQQYTSFDVVYTITNSGSSVINNIVVNTPQPSGSTNSSSSATQGNFDLFREKWEVGNLAVGASASFTWTIFAVGAEGIQGFGQVEGETEKVTFSISQSNLQVPNTGKSTTFIGIDKIQLRPTITNGQTQLSLVAEEEQRLTVEIYTLTGQVVKRENLLINRGLNQVELDVSSLGAGAYFVKVGALKTLRLVKL